MPWQRPEGVTDLPTHRPANKTSEEKDGQALRNILRYTNERQLTDAEQWLGNAKVYHKAGDFLYSQWEVGNLDLRVALFNVAISLELLFKAAWVIKHNSAPVRNHRLRQLADAAEISVSEDHSKTLDVLTHILFWRGRYPAPLDEEFWNEFHDKVLEDSLDRSQSGHTRTNLDIFPSRKVCLLIWDDCLRQYEEYRA